jgi:hypothetical protein
VLDRPNPLGGEVVEGNLPRPGYESFVGAFATPVRHGLTLGELLLLEARRRGWDGEGLRVWEVEGWRRGDGWADGRPWIAPSPNMPTLETALVYPGGCLVEGTELSEGRGTTRPFQLTGAPGSTRRRSPTPRRPRAARRRLRPHLLPAAVPEARRRGLRRRRDGGRRPGGGRPLPLRLRAADGAARGRPGRLRLARRPLRVRRRPAGDRPPRRLRGPAARDRRRRPRRARPPGSALGGGRGGLPRERAPILLYPRETWWEAGVAREAR